MADLADTRISLAGQGALVGIARTASASNACVVRVAGSEATARVVTRRSVAVGALLLVFRRGAVSFVTDKVPAAPSSPPTPPSTTPPDSGDTAPDPKPIVTTGRLVCSPVTT
ncbi:hypothetical protein DMH04_56790, partial [Kibdelosporangium aridum]